MSLESMVKNQIIGRGIVNEEVISAIRKVPREQFIRSWNRYRAFDDGPIGIGFGQTISQPYIVAYMTEALDIYPDSRVLDIGTGSGYQTAILSLLAKQIFTVELIPELLDRARTLLHALGFDNISYLCDNGYLGWEKKSPFDRILVAAAADSIPEALINQLKPQGKMIIPVNSGFDLQTLKLVTKTESGETNIKSLLKVRFVPLVNPVK